MSVDKVRRWVENNSLFENMDPSRLTLEKSVRRLGYGPRRGGPGHIEHGRFKISICIESEFHLVRCDYKSRLRFIYCPDTESLIEYITRPVY